MEHVLGILQTGDLLKKALPGGHCITAADIESVLHPPLYVPETVTTTQLLENFRRARLQFALIVDEYGDVQGVVTLTDVMSAIVGELSEPEKPEERDMIQREDGSWLVDGDVGVERMKSVLDIEDELPGEEDKGFHTLGGFIMHALGRIPAPTDHFEAAGWRFEVMDMDKNRVDKVLLSKITESVQVANESR
jgi:putative hemolysin